MAIYSRKKSRGQRRRLREDFDIIDKYYIPFEYTSEKYEHFNTPGDQFFLESPKTSGKVKTAFCRKWIEKTEEFIAQKPKDLPFCKIVAFITVPEFWGSDITIFYDKEYYDNFWNRNQPENTWIAIEDKNISFAKTRNIQTSLSEQGYICKYDYIEPLFGEDRIAGQYQMWWKMRNIHLTT